MDASAHIDIAPPVPAVAKLNGRDPSPMSPQPLIWREMEQAAEINRILNDADVFPFITMPHQAALDVSDAVTNPNFVFLRCDGGVIIFVPDPEPASGIYEAHINFLANRRGHYAVMVVRAALDYIFTRTNAVFLFTRVPANNLPALGMVRAIHGSPWFCRAKAWPGPDGRHDLGFYSLTLHDWLRHSATFPRAGRWFHRHLETEFERLGVPHDGHGDDDGHDRAVGAAVEMIRGGQYIKALIVYNRWARAAGFAQIRLVSEVPLVIDTDDALLRVSGDTFRMIKAKET